MATQLEMFTGCRPKRHYPTEAAAQAAIDKLVDIKRNNAYHVQPLPEAYQCRFCGSWHLLNTVAPWGGVVDHMERQMRAEEAAR